jgi:hypothetical protein
VIFVDTKNVLRHILQENIPGRIDVKQEPRSGWLGCHHIRLRCKQVDVLHGQGDGPHYREKNSLSFGEFSQTHLHFTNQVKVMNKMHPLNVFVIQKFGVRVDPSECCPLINIKNVGR